MQFVGEISLYSLEKAKCVLESNQYPPDFYEPIIQKALAKCLDVSEEKEQSDSGAEPSKEAEPAEKEPTVKRLIFIEYSGKVTEDYCRALRKINAPCQPVLTLRKLKTVMPSLKPAIDKHVRSHIIYKITCPRCKSCYIGATCRCLDVHFREHKTLSQPDRKSVV